MNDLAEFYVDPSVKNYKRAEEIYLSYSNSSLNFCPNISKCESGIGLNDSVAILAQADFRRQEHPVAVRRANKTHSDGSRSLS